MALVHSPFINANYYIFQLLHLGCWQLSRQEKNLSSPWPTISVFIKPPCRDPHFLASEVWGPKHGLGAHSPFINANCYIFQLLHLGCLVALPSGQELVLSVTYDLRVYKGISLHPYFLASGGGGQNDLSAHSPLIKLKLLYISGITSWLLIALPSGQELTLSVAYDLCVYKGTLSTSLFLQMTTGACGIIAFLFSCILIHLAVMSQAKSARRKRKEDFCDFDI